MLFIPLCKVDAAQRLIYARIDETPDRVGDVFDYVTSKPQFEKWSEEMRKASDGKNLGNIRAMHQLIAAGKVEQIDYDDQGRGIEICATITDDGEWKKCLDGTYTGISPGGRYLKRWNDGNHRRYTAGPQEISLVDRPMIPTATFTMVKADGAIEERHFQAVDEMARLVADVAAARSRAELHGIITSLPASMVEALFEDPEMAKVAETHGLGKRDCSAYEREALAKQGKALPDGSYPIDNKDDLQKAVDAYGRSGDKQAAKALIIKRANELGATDLLPEDWDGSTKKLEKAATIGGLRKGLSDVASLSGLIQSLTWLCSCVTMEAAGEGDGSPLPARLAAAIQEMADILVAMATEESGEAVAQLKAAIATIPGSVMQQAASIADLAKAGARHSKEDLARVQQIHDTARDLGADCDTMTKAAGVSAGALMKIAFDLAASRDENVMLKRENAALKAQPAGGGPVLRTADRGQDVGTARAASVSTSEVPKEIADMPNGPEKTARLMRWTMDHPTPPSTPTRR